MKTPPNHFYPCLLVLILAGCTEAQSDRPSKTVTVNDQLCQSKMEFTSRAVGPYIIKIFEPNDAKNPDIWQGPMCIQSATKKVNCGFELSLVKAVKPALDLKSIDVVVFSGSNSRTARITLATCDIQFLE